MVWETIERPGYLGKKRDEIISSWDEKFGKNNWRIAYKFGDSVLPKEMGIQIYEDAYYQFFDSNHNILEWLIFTASNVYDTAPSNVNSHFDYNIQETSNNHIHDIAIRRAIARVGFNFMGDHLVHVRWKDSEGFRINPGIVPFHKPNLILAGEIKDYGEKGFWWNEKTIEDFYQRNKLLQVLSD